MPAFDYSAYNTAGKQISGIIEADTDRQARRLLKDRHLLPLSISEIRKSSNSARQALGKSANRLSPFDLSLILRQLAILIQSGLPVEEAMKMTIEQAENAKQARVVQSWRSEIVEGRSFSDALSRCPYRIPDSVIAGVGVGEESGHLHDILLRLADEQENNAENRKTVSRALIYPLTLIITSIAVISIMMLWVVPKITVIFASSDRELPLITRIIVGLSEFTQSYGLYLFLFAILAFILWHQALKDPQRKRRWHAFLLRLPGLGAWIRMANIADWSRSLGILLGSGVPALSALKISSATVNNLYLRKKMEAVTENMRQGSTLQKALTENDLGSGFLNHMVGSGEASSQLDQMLLRVADYYGLRLKNAVEVFLKIFNPILIILMGLVILSIVAAVMLPIMDMNNMI
ncbi:MAG: general secretion pathway protein GspF [Gammaproteobacteria bacterium]|nr:general secretion pathway protein GspF [Gammaproteobacteria bacterium]MAY02361.1 general secretion pathway protein GspF [Gammaproteobacteria bacterium]|tara:strand:- start:141 stop:1355 length:1215 start_codon:yes stop_codon:yes gene_type:complete